MDVVVWFPLSFTVDRFAGRDVGGPGLRDVRDYADQGPFADRDRLPVDGRGIQVAQCRAVLRVLRRTELDAGVFGTPLQVLEAFEGEEHGGTWSTELVLGLVGPPLGLAVRRIVL